jgi:hypothetical protein
VQRGAWGRVSTQLAAFNPRRHTASTLDKSNTLTPCKGPLFWSGGRVVLKRLRDCMATTHDEDVGRASRRASWQMPFMISIVPEPPVEDSGTAH